MFLPQPKPEPTPVGQSADEDTFTLGDEAQPVKEEKFIRGEEKKPQQEPIKLTDVVPPEQTTGLISQSTLPDWVQERLRALGYSDEQIAQTTDE